MLLRLTASTMMIPLMAALTASKPLDQQAPLQVQILDVQKNKGKVVVALFKSKADWLQKPFRTMILAADGNTAKASFDVPHGKYAVTIFQDTNENEKLDQNFLGIPKEPIGFGNNYKPFGKPDFEAALVEHGPSSKPEPIKLFSLL